MIINKLKNICVVFIASLLITGISHAYEIEMNKQGKSYALLIGINQYSNYPHLQTPTNNVETLAKILIQKFDFQSQTIVKVTDKTPPTYQVIEKQLIDLGKRLTTRDQLLIYFSGHCQMDEKGDTFWIPANGDASQKNGFNHSYLINTLIKRNLNDIRHIVIISEGYFSKDLFQEQNMPPLISKSLYKQWLNKKSYLKSREIFTLNDRFWGQNTKTNGLGLFAYYLTEALKNIDKRRISLSDALLNSDLIHGPIGAITGINVAYGRLKNTLDQGGQFVLEKAKVLPKVTISHCQTNPQIGYVGDPFVISCHTSDAAARVSIKMDGRFYDMTGINNVWKYHTHVNNPDKTFFYVRPYNKEKVKGPEYKGFVETVPHTPAICNLVSSRVSPTQGRLGKIFHFYAKSDIPTNHVDLYINGQKHAMKGTGTNWSFSKKIEAIGKSYFTMVTSNTSGAIGQMQQGFLETLVPPVNVTKSKVKPEYGYIGDTFVFTCVTDRSAKEVFIEINGETYAMKGFSRDWIFKIQLDQPGLVEYEMVALNEMKEKGDRQSGNFSISRKPLSIPDVVDISILPQTIYKGESFLIKAETSASSRMVYIDINNQKDIFKGNETQWFYKTRIHKPQSVSFRVLAKNHRGMQGLAKDRMVRINEIPFNTIKIIHSEVTPKKCDVGSDVFFHVLTDKPAKKVHLVLNNDQLPMNGQDQEWQLTQKIDLMGTLYFAIIPINSHNVKGISYVDHIEITPGNPKVDWIRISPEKPSQNEPVTVHARTDKPAQRMILYMDNISYPMNSANRDFYFKHTFASPGTYHFILKPYNLKNDPGTSKKGSIKVFEPDSPVPQIVSVNIKPMETGFFLHEKLLFSAITDVPAKKTQLILNDTTIEMNGVKNAWHHVHMNTKTGQNTYIITAFNDKNQPGKAKKGQFNIRKKAEPPVNITKVEVNPSKGKTGDLFHFSATTNRPANRVKLVIGDTTYDMAGKDTRWHTQINGYEPGDIQYYIAAFNQSGFAGMIQTGLFTVIPPVDLPKPVVFQARTFTPLPPEDRFMIHDNGTITDKSTNLMWTKAPKTIPETYDAAIHYCQNLNINGFQNWRLPTIDEWKLLIDQSQQNPALPKGHSFESIRTGIGYWSKTTHRFGPQYKYQMKLWYGKVGYMNKSQRALIWPVRYAGFD